VLAVLAASATVTLNRYNFETVEYFRESLDQQVAEIREARCSRSGDLPPRPDCEDVDAHFVEIAFAQHPDASERDFLAALPTSLQLSESEVARTIAAGRRLLLESPDFQALLVDLTGLPTPEGDAARAFEASEVGVQR
jgi:NTE family protein